MPLNIPYDPLLPRNVPGIADLRLDALRHGGGHALAAANDLRDQIIADVGPPHQLDGRTADLAQLRALGGGGAQVGQFDARRLQPVQLGLLDLAVTAEQCPAVIVHQPILAANRGQPLVGVVLAQTQAVLAAARHHAVGVHDPLRDKVVHQRAEVACVPRQHKFFPAQRVAGGVQTRQQALRSGLLIAGRAVELPRAVDAAHDLAFQRGLERRGVHAVILDGVGRAHDFEMLKPGNRAVHLVLHGLGQAGRETLQVHFLGVLAAWLHKDRVALLLFKADDLVLNGRAVPRADALNVAAVERRAVQIVENDLMGRGIRVGDVAVDLVVHRHAGHKAERLQLGVGVAGLAFELREVDAAAVDAGGRAGLEAAQREAVLHKAPGQRGGGVGAVGAAVIVGIPHKDAPAQVGAGGNDDGLAGVVAVQVREHAADLAVLHVHADDLALVDVEVGGLLQRVLHPDVVALAVCLHAQTVYGGAFAAVEHPALQVGGVCGQTHQPAERIDLPHKMPLGCAADGRVARHIADEIQRQRKHRGPCPQPCRRMRRLDPRMPRTDDDDVVASQFVHIRSLLPYIVQDVLTDTREICVHCIVGVAQHPAADALQVGGALCIVLNGLRFGVLCAVQLYYQFTR